MGVCDLPATEPSRVFRLLKTKFLADVFSIFDISSYVKINRNIFEEILDFIRIIEQAERFIEEQGFDKSNLAKKLGFSSRYIADIKAGKSKKPGSDFVLALINRLNFNPVWLETGSGEMLLSNQANSLEKTSKTGLTRLPVYLASELPEGAFIVPLLDQGASAGPGSYLPEEDKAKALIHVPAYLSHYGDKLAALTVEGDSMYPTLHRGDMVVCDSCGWSGEGIYALRMSGAGFVKRITKRPGKYVIISDNPKYPPQEEPAESEDIEIIGRVHCAITRIE
jgi:phage repressor protein C with HTH and peptisase S24 domain